MQQNHNAEKTSLTAAERGVVRGGGGVGAGRGPKKAGGKRRGVVREERQSDTRHEAEKEVATNLHLPL